MGGQQVVGAVYPSFGGFTRFVMMSLYLRKDPLQLPVDRGWIDCHSKPPSRDEVMYSKLSHPNIVSIPSAEAYEDGLDCARIQFC